MTDTRDIAREAIELAPCPFCGGKAITVSSGFPQLVPPRRYGVVCEGDCGVFLDIRKPSESEAIAAWNDRADARSLLELREENERLRRNLDGRDSFIVNHGHWQDFCDELRKSGDNAQSELATLREQCEGLTEVAKMVDAWGNGLRHHTAHEGKMVKAARATLQAGASALRPPMEVRPNDAAVELAVLVEDLCGDGNG